MACKMINENNSNYNIRLLEIIREEQKILKQKKKLIKFYIAIESLKFWKNKRRLDNLKSNLASTEGKQVRLKIEEAKLLNQNNK